MAASSSQTTRRSVIAGTWYPGTQKSLASAVDGYFALVDQPPVAGELLGLISPHAGYAYSGQTAAYAYHQLHGQQVDTVVLIGPSHRAWVGDYAVSAEHAYETPLGRVPLDLAFVDEAMQRDRRDALGRGVDVHERVALERLRARRVAMACPQVDDHLALDRQGDAGAELVPVREFLRERVLHARELGMAFALDLDRGHGGSFVFSAACGVRGARVKPAAGMRA